MTDNGEEPVRVRVLGPVGAWRGDAELGLGSARRRSVFAILALRAGEAVSRAELVDGLWGERPPAKAVGILHTYISDLRRALEPARDRRTGPGTLRTIQSSYSLRLPAEHLDLRRFAAHRDQAGRHWSRGDLPAALDALDAALALWHGEALRGASGPFVEMQRARLAEARISAVERRAALLLVRGEHERVHAELAALVAAAPLRETARGLVMVALHQAGRRAEACELYRETERLLADELGLAPGPALRRIHREVKAGLPVPADVVGAGIWTPQATVAAPAAVPRQRPAAPPLLAGRDGDLAWLRSYLPGLLDGRGDCAGVEGPPGIGKTALVATAFDEAPEGCEVCWSVAGELAGEDPGPAPSPVVTQVERLCARGPVVLVVDDLHLVDDDGLLVWNRLCRLTRRLPLLLVGVFRGLPVRAGLVRLRGAVGAVGGRTRTLAPLAPAAVAELVAARAGKVAPARLDTVAETVADTVADPGVGSGVNAVVGTGVGTVIDTVVDAAGGNPALAESLAESLAEAGTATDEAAARVVGWLRLVTPATRDALGWAALLGRRFDLGELAAVTGTDAADLVAVVAEAVAAGVLDDHGERLAFRGGALYRALLDPDPGRHRVVAEALAGLGAPADRIAAHLLHTTRADPWTAAWVLRNGDALEPATALALLDLAVAGTSSDDARHGPLVAARTRLGCRPCGGAARYRLTGSGVARP